MLSHAEVAHKIAQLVTKGGRLAMCEEALGLPVGGFPKEIRLNAPRGAELKALEGTERFVAWKESFNPDQWPAASGFSLSVSDVSVNRARKKLPRAIYVESLEGALAALRYLSADQWQATHSAIELWREHAKQLVTAVVAARVRYGQPVGTASTGEQPDGQQSAHELARFVASQLPKEDKANADSVADLVATLHYLADPSQSPQGQSFRQVSIPGVQGKWLERHYKPVVKLLGVDPFEQKPVRVRRVQLTYLDPEHLSRPGARKYDVYVHGQANPLEYAPHVLLVCENQESADRFRPVSGAIAVQGDGNAVAALLEDRSLLEMAQHVVYWGDIDERGLSILAMLRQRFGADVRSILMDYPAYRKYSERAGTNKDVNGQDIRVEHLKAPGLTVQEQRAFDAVTGPNPAPYRRIEQERIPLDDALAALHEVIGGVQKFQLPGEVPVDSQMLVTGEE